MRNLRGGLGSLLVALMLGLPAASEPYQNPVIPFAETEVADPYVLKHRGEYYLYTSGDPILAFHSRDLVHWDPLGPVLRSTAGAWNEADVWAPEVIYRDGKFLMYYTASRKGSDWRVGEMQRRVGVAVSDSPAGPFVDSGHPITPTWAIDGHVFTDRQGQDWLFYSFLQEPEHPGAGIAVDRLLAYDKVAGTPTVCLQGSEAWEDKDGDPHNGSLRYTNEGPTVIERDGTLYLFYSGGSWDRPTYAVGYATASAPQGPWTKVVPPVLRATPLVDGPGHNALTTAPNGLDDIHLYHARTQPYLDPSNRAPFVDRLHWAGKRPAVSPPSLGLSSPPDRPLFRDLFDAEGKPGPQWRQAGEAFEVKGGVLHGRGSQVALHLLERTDGPYLFETSLRLSKDSRAGITLSDPTGHEVVPLILDAQNRVLRTDQKTLHGLPASFKTDAYHALSVLDNGTSVSVLLDGVTVGEIGATGLSPSLSIESGAAEFDGVALSLGFHESFANGVAPGGWEGHGGPFSSTAGGWLQSGQGFAWRTKGPYSTRYELSATLQPRDTSAPLVAKPGPTDGKWWAGVVAARDASGRMLLAGYDKGIWPFGRFRVWQVQDGKVEAPLEVGLPRGFRYDTFHTIRVVRDEDRFTFFLDEQEIAATRLTMPEAQAGIFTQNVAATFSHADYKTLVVEQNLLLNGSFETEQWDGEKAAHGNPWSLSGAARPNESAAHSGVRRLLFRPGQGRAEQKVSLEAGAYRLHAFALGRDAQLTLAAGKVSRAVGPIKESWSHVTLDFTLESPVDMSIALAGISGPEGYLAVDDVWLEPR